MHNRCAKLKNVMITGGGEAMNEQDKDIRVMSSVYGYIDFLEKKIIELEKDKARLDWLADRKNTIGNVQLPTQCVVDHPDDMRAAIDAAMALCAGE